MSQKPSLRFDHREIAVIFSLFVFVSLLMFTVGILVGKGLAQAKYEAALLQAVKPAPTESALRDASHDKISAQTGTSVTASGTVPADEPSRPASDGETVVATSESARRARQNEPLRLVPKEANVGGAPDNLMRNPKIQALLDEEAGLKPRGQANKDKLMPTAPPQTQSVPQGSFTVQVGSYPTQKDALERVEALKKLGFPYAYFSAKELGDQKETWFRVWLGYYNDFESAKRSGEILQHRGEVKNYLVRKTDTSG